MGKYIKLFENHTQYEQYITGETAVLPNVSHCIQEAEVHYNPIVTETRLIVNYSVTDASEPTPLYCYMTLQDITVNGAAMFDKIEIDGTEVPIADIDAEEGAYQLSSGEHTVRYTLKDPTIIGTEWDETGDVLIKVGADFYGCKSIMTVKIPNSVTTIATWAFASCTALASVTLGSGITSIGENAFCGCTSLDTASRTAIEAVNPNAASRACK